MQGCPSKEDWLQQATSMVEMHAIDEVCVPRRVEVRGRFVEIDFASRRFFLSQHTGWFREISFLKVAHYCILF